MMKVQKYFITFGRNTGPCVRRTVHTAYPNKLRTLIEDYGYTVYMFKRMLT